MSDVWVVSATCGDYYCGCGIAHLVGVATSEEIAENMKTEAEARTHRYPEHGEDGESFSTFYEASVTRVTLNEQLPSGFGDDV